MTPDKQTKDAKEQQKKKIIIGVVVVIILIVIWQMMGSGSTPTAEPTSVATAPGKAGAPGAMTAAGPNGQAAPAAQPEIVAPKQEKLAVNPEIARMQQQAETDYVTSLNKLQMLKLQKEIDETKTAIAAAELNRMTAEKNIADMITSTQNIAPAAPAPAATNQAAPPPPPQVIHGPPVKSEASYTLMSVSYEGGRWSAVVGLEGKLFTVSVGDVLQPDDSVVMAINKKEIQLKRDTRTRTVAISSSPL